MFRYAPNTIKFNEISLKELDFLITYFGAFIDIARAYEITYDPRLPEVDAHHAELSARWLELTDLTEREINYNLDDHRVVLKPTSGFVLEGPVVYFHVEIQTLGDGGEESEDRPVIHKLTHRLFTMTTTPIQTVTNDELHEYILDILHLSPREEVFYDQISTILENCGTDPDDLLQALKRHHSYNTAMWNSQCLGDKVLRERFSVQPSIVMENNNIVAEITVYDQQLLTKLYHSVRHYPLAKTQEA